MDVRDMLPARVPLSVIDNFIPKRIIAIPKLKSSVKKSACNENTATSTYDELRNLVEVFVLDRAAVAQANSYINELQHQSITLRNRIADLEENLFRVTTADESKTACVPPKPTEVPKKTASTKVDKKKNVQGQSKLYDSASSLYLISSHDPIQEVPPLPSHEALPTECATSDPRSDSMDSNVTLSIGMSVTPSQSTGTSVTSSPIGMTEETPSGHEPVMRRSNRRASMSATALSRIEGDETVKTKGQHLKKAPPKALCGYDDELSNTGDASIQRKSPRKDVSSTPKSPSARSHSIHDSSQLSRSPSPLLFNITESEVVLVSSLHGFAAAGSCSGVIPAIEGLRIADLQAVEPTQNLNSIPDNNNVYNSSDNSSAYNSSMDYPGDEYDAEANYGVMMYDSAFDDNSQYFNPSSYDGSSSLSSMTPVAQDVAGDAAGDVAGVISDICVDSTGIIEEITEENAEGISGSITEGIEGIAGGSTQQKSSMKKKPAATRRMSGRFRSKPSRFLEEAGGGLEGVEGGSEMSVTIGEAARKSRVKREKKEERKEGVASMHPAIPISDSMAVSEAEPLVSMISECGHYEVEDDVDEFSMVMRMDDCPAPHYQPPSIPPSIPSPQYNPTSSNPKIELSDMHPSSRGPGNDRDSSLSMPLRALSSGSGIGVKGIKGIEATKDEDSLGGTDCSFALSSSSARGASPLSAGTSRNSNRNSFLLAASTRAAPHPIQPDARNQSVGERAEIMGADNLDSLLLDRATPSSLKKCFDTLSAAAGVLLCDCDLISDCQTALNRSHPAGMGFTTALLFLVTAAYDTSAANSQFLTAFAFSLPHLVRYLGGSDQQETSTQVKAHTPTTAATGVTTTTTTTATATAAVKISSKKSVRFCDVDGSSVATPGKDCAHEPALSTLRRLHSLVQQIDRLISDIDDLDGDRIFNRVLRGCLLLSDPVSAAKITSTLFTILSLSVPAGELSAIAGMFASELTAASKVRSQTVAVPSLDGTRTVLRHRVGWMATSVLRARLRWILDPPPAHLSIPGAGGHPVRPLIRSRMHKMVSLREGKSCMTNTCKKKRRMSDIAVVDHTIVHPCEMTLSSLLTHALRQIYDAFASAVASSPSQSMQGPSVDIFVTEFLTAGVTAASQGEDSGPLLEGLEHSQPQLALAAELGKSFIRTLLTYPAVSECISEEKELWAVVQESAVLISQHGMSEDRHLCLFAGGWKGLLGFTQQRLISEEAEVSCTQYVTSLAAIALIGAGDRSVIDEDAILLNNSIIYDFPEIYPNPNP